MSVNTILLGIQCRTQDQLENRVDNPPTFRDWTVIVFYILNQPFPVRQPIFYSCRHGINRLYTIKGSFQYNDAFNAFYSHEIMIK